MAFSGTTLEVGPLRGTWVLDGMLVPSGAVLSDAGLNGAGLNGAGLGGADVGGVGLSGANLNGIGLGGGPLAHCSPRVLIPAPLTLMGVL